MARADRGGDRQAQGCAALSDRDTIIALSSGRLPAAIAILRLSGPDALAAASTLAGTLPSPRRASLRALRTGDGELLDRALVIVFPGGESATGEDLVELHCHGGRAVVAAVERALLACPGVRAAQPGEFTRRAVLNGRIDLTQAAGLADLLAAETESERRLAMRNAEGAVRRRIEGWMDRLTTMAAELEAAIDFAEEGDVVAEGASVGRVDEARRALIADIDAVLEAPPVERWRDGWRVVIAGPPNAGKSTLLNLLAERDAAIVSATAGTTRDRIEVPVQRNGVGYILTDTAGLRDDTDDEVERIGIGRTHEAVGGADLVLWLGDVPPADRQRTLWVLARADLPGRGDGGREVDVATSRHDPVSIDRVWGAIERWVLPRALLDQPALRNDDRERCRNVRDALAAFSDDIVLAAEALRRSRRELGQILGIDATEQLLDRVFARFCLGK